MLAPEKRITKDLFRVAVIAATLQVSGTPVYGTDHEIRIASWNIRNLSSNSRSDAELGIISLVLFRYDLIAIQEVRTDDMALKRIKKILKDDFQAEFEIEVSEPVGTEDRLERYAYLWRTDRVSLTGAGRFFDDPADQFVREPYCASFASGNFDWTMCTVHIKFGDSEADRRPEIEALDDVYRSVKAEGPERDIIICGDFNFPPDDIGWTELKSEDGMRFAIASPFKTTVAVNNSLYDNCWYPDVSTEIVEDSGSVLAFDELMYPLGSLKEAKRLTSDHRPISIRARIDLPDDD